MHKYFGDVINFFEDKGLPFPKGCTEEEIDLLERIIGFKLPDAYRAYLSLMGNDHNGVMRGTDCFADSVEENTGYLPGLLEENKVKFQLPENYLAFFCHQGYIIAWFELPAESNNPVCYLFSEGSTKEPIEYGGFKQFITKDIMGNAKIEVELKLYKKWWQFWK